MPVRVPGPSRCSALSELPVLPFLAPRLLRPWPYPRLIQTQTPHIKTSRLKCQCDGQRGLQQQISRPTCYQRPHQLQRSLTGLALDQKQEPRHPVTEDPSNKRPQKSGWEKEWKNLLNDGHANKAEILKTLGRTAEAFGNDEDALAWAEEHIQDISTIENISKEWEKLSFNERTIFWPTIILQYLQTSPRNAIHFLKATFLLEPERWEPYSGDCINYLCTFYLEDAKGSDFERNYDLLSELLEILDHNFKLQHRYQFLIFVLIKHATPLQLVDLFSKYCTDERRIRSWTLLQFSRAFCDVGDTNSALKVLKLPQIGQMAYCSNPYVVKRFQSGVVGLVNAVRLNDPDNLFNIFEELLIMYPSCSNSYNVVILCCIGQGDYRGAWDIYESMLQLEITPNEMTFSTLLKMVKERLSPEDLQRIIKEATSFGILDSASPQYQSESLPWEIRQYYSLLIVNSLREGEIRNAMDLYELSKQQNFEPTFTMLWFFLQDASNRRDFNMAQWVIKEASSLGLMQTNRMFGSSAMVAIYRIYSGSRRTGYAAMLSVYRTFFSIKPLVDLGIVSGHTMQLDDTTPEPSLAVLKPLIMAFVRQCTNKEKLYDIWLRYQHLVNTGHPVISRLVADDYINNAFIISFGELKATLKFCTRVLEFMLQPTDVNIQGTFEPVTKQVPTIYTWTVVLYAFSRHGQRKAAEKVLTMMKKRDITPNSVTFNSLLSSHARAHDIMAVVNVLERMQDADLEMDSHTFTILSVNGMSSLLEEAFRQSRENRGLDINSKHAEDGLEDIKEGRETLFEDLGGQGNEAGLEDRSNEDMHIDNEHVDNQHVDLAVSSTMDGLSER
ncbi:MAG: hypothetical protein M1834_002070 [Cirrosporium novae-zelandiae]|nr:MAG: hypothetical protein M1834_002070 [Cirrosporium novae-zelandiae]